MSSSREVLTAILLVMAISGLSIDSTLGQQSSPRKPPPAVIKYNGDMASILATLSEVYDTSIGLELEPPQTHVQVEFYLRDPSLPDVLNAIVQSAPRYQWRDVGGFVEVFPLAGRNALLDTRVMDFKVQDVNSGDAIGQLIKMSEVQTSMGMLNLKLQPPTAPGQESGSKFSLRLENVTLREALNSIAKQSGARFWVFRTDKQGTFSVRTSI